MPKRLTTFDKNALIFVLKTDALIFVLKTGFGNNKLLFWAKRFNVFDPIQHDLINPNFITLLR